VAVPQAPFRFGTIRESGAKKNLAANNDYENRKKMGVPHSSARCVIILGNGELPEERLRRYINVLVLDYDERTGGERKRKTR